MGEALVETKEVKDLISSHKTLQILMDTQLTIQGKVNAWSAQTVCQHASVIELYLLFISLP